MGNLMARLNKVHFITFGTTEFRVQQECLARSAQEFGQVDEVELLGPANIKGTSFYASHRDILDYPRGAGYWLWKPYLILAKLASVAPGDVVIYSDCGRGSGYQFHRSALPLIDWAANSGHGAFPGISIPHFGPNAIWTKRDCFVHMACDSPRFWHHPQIQATHSVWIKSSFTCDFVETWLRLCCDPRIITDAPNACGMDNLPGFKDHRHDQSVLTNLVIEANLPFIDGSLGIVGRIIPPKNWNTDLLKDINNIILCARGISAGTIYAMRMLRGRISKF